MGLSVGQISYPSVKKYFFGKRGPPSVIGPTVSQRGPSSIRGASVYQSGPLSVRLAVSQSKNIFLVRGTLCCLTLEGPPSVIGPSLGQMGAPPSEEPSVGQRGPSVYQRGPSVYQRGPLSVKNILLVRGALRRLTEVVLRSEEALNRPWDSLSNRSSYA